MRPMSFVSQLFPEGNVPIVEASLRFAHHRQTAIANNLANIDTPHYQRRDVDEEVFQRMLRRAIRTREEEHPGQWRLENDGSFDVHERRFPEILPGRPNEYPHAAGEAPVRHDENNVAIEAELVALQRNTLAIRALQQLFGRSVGGTANAVRFRVQ